MSIFSMNIISTLKGEIFMGKLSNEEKELLLQAYTNQCSEELFQRPPKALNQDEKNMLEEYMLDKSKPEWRQIVDDNGIKYRFLISNVGQIMSMDTGLIKTPTEDKDGYLMTAFHMGDHHYTSSVHRLVAKAFIENPYNKEQVNHINANKKCNWYQNLEWCTQRENFEHAVRMGLEDHIGLKGEANPKNVYTEKQIRDACKLLEDPNNRPVEIANITGVSRITLYNLRLGNIWQDVVKDYNIPERDHVHGESNVNNKYTENQIHEVCKLLETGLNPTAVMYRTGVDKSTVQRIRKGESWVHVSSRYKFPEIDYTHGSTKVQAVYSDKQIWDTCKALMDPYKTQEQVSKETGVSADVICRIVKGKMWTHISSQFNIPPRKNRKTEIIITMHENGKKTGEIYDALVKEFGNSDRRKTMLQIRDVVRRHEKKK